MTKKKAVDYNYLTEGGCTEVPTMDDVEEFKLTIKGFEQLEMKQGTGHDHIGHDYVCHNYIGHNHYIPAQDQGLRAARDETRLQLWHK